MDGIGILRRTATRSTNLVNMAACLRDRVVPGSFPVIFHLIGGQLSASRDPVHPRRTREEVVRLFSVGVGREPWSGTA
jgi:hypothetical protein